jgi:hypothetical protein
MSITGGAGNGCASVARKTPIPEREGALLRRIGDGGIGADGKVGIIGSGGLANRQCE